MAFHGVRWYRSGKTAVTVAFPEGKMTCQSCRAFLRYDNNTGGRYCFLTNEPIPNPDRQIGGRCPLEMEAEDDKNTTDADRR